MKKEKLPEEDLDKLLNQLSVSVRSPRGKYTAAAGYSKLQEKIRPTKKKRIPLLRYAVAASIALLVSLSTYFFISGTQPEMIVVTTDSNIEEITLPDGTLVTLGRYSSLQYPSKYKKGSRDVILTGEGFFDVVKNEDHPFIVYADEVHIRVLGTQFNVQAYSKDTSVKTTLIQGKVAIGIVQNNESIILQPNESAFFIKESREIYKEVNTDALRDIAWRDGRFIFNNKPLHEIANRLGNYFNVQIDIDSSDLKEYRISASFEQEETLEDILNILQTAANFAWQKENAIIKIKNSN